MTLESTHLQLNLEYNEKNNNNNNNIDSKSKIVNSGSNGNVYLQISGGTSYDYLKNFKLISLIFICSLGFLSTGTFIGWTSNYFKINIYSEMFTCSQISYISSILPIGALFGAVLIGTTKLPKYMGIKKILMISSLMLALSLGIFYVDLQYSFINLLVSRFVSGISIGILHVLLPMYVIQFASNDFKPIFEYILYTNFAVGILMQYISGFCTSVFVSTTISSTATAFFLIGTIMLPESPQYLWNRKMYSESREILEEYCGTTEIIESQTNKFNFEKISQYDGSILDEIFDKENFPIVLPFLIFTIAIQLMGGYSMFFYLWKTFIHLESVFSPETISVTSSAIFVIALPLYLVVGPDFKDKLMLKITTFIMFMTCLCLGGYIHQLGVTETPTSHGYIPLVIFCVYTFAYSIGPYRILINYIQTITNSCNAFALRVAYNFVTWATIFVCTNLLPTLIDFIGIGWVFWYMAIAGIFAFFFVIYFLPDVQSSIVELKILDSVLSSSDDSIE